MRVLLVLICVLTLAASASADCAWIVWGPSEESGLVVRAGYATWSNC